MNRLIIAALPLLVLALSAGAEASLRMDGFARTASGGSGVDAGGVIELGQHDEAYDDENYYGDQGHADDYSDEYGDALPEDQPVEDEYADEEGYEDEYADEEGYEDEVEDDDYYNKDPQSLVQPGDTFDPYAPQ